MVSAQRLRTEPLTPQEAEALLERNHLGRLAYAFRDHVDIRPLGYIFRDGWIFGRTEPGVKIETLLHHRWIAFQVDEIQDQWNWSSVVVQGAFHVLEPDAPGEEGRVRKRALAALSEAFEGLFGPEDPASHRTVLFGIAPQEIVGRRAWLAEGDPVA
jgi:uncharacterized protein